MKINIVLPYNNSTEQVYSWSLSEETIDFRKDHFDATRCTVSFATTEILQYLNKFDINVTISEKADDSSFNLFLSYVDEANEDADYTLRPEKNGLSIIGKGRIGVLYGAYEFLKMQGIRWLNPDTEILPEAINEINVPKEEKEYAPSMNFGRGFDFEGPLKESKKLYLWMARNRLNLSSYRVNTYKFQKKLGMIFKNGGHIFEAMLNPANKTEHGINFWEAHRDWYGADSEKNAFDTQFCTSNQEALEYLSQKLVDRLNGEWYFADRIDVWGFDTWGKTCECEKCKALGNGSDKWLHFISYLRDFINEKIRVGELDHNVTLVMCSYEGTSTLPPPINEIPSNLKTSGDAIVVYPINRCYKHNFADENCSKNKMYNNYLKGWSDIPVIIGEYYNVSKFEDLPLVFTKSMTQDLRYYYNLGVRGMTYMHLPMVEWGVRNLTQLLYASLGWDMDTDVESFVKQYYTDRYGEYAKDAEKVYDILEHITDDISIWRSWDRDCILSQLKNWDGKPAKHEFYHYHKTEDLIENGYKLVEQMKEAYDVLYQMRQKETNKQVAVMVSKTGDAVNPIDTSFDVSFPVVESIEEDMRLVKYGMLSMELLVMFADYHESWSYDNMCDELWAKIEERADEAISLYTPINYHGTQPELAQRDVLERAQLKTVYYRCKQNREVK